MMTYFDTVGFQRDRERFFDKLDGLTKELKRFNDNMEKLNNLTNNKDKVEIKDLDNMDDRNVY